MRLLVLLAVWELCMRRICAGLPTCNDGCTAVGIRQSKSQDVHQISTTSPHVKKSDIRSIPFPQLSVQQLNHTEHYNNKINLFSIVYMGNCDSVISI